MNLWRSVITNIVSGKWRDSETGGGHTRLKIWYNPCIIRQYIHNRTAENHLLFSKYSIGDVPCLRSTLLSHGMISVSHIRRHAEYITIFCSLGVGSTLGFAAHFKGKSIKRELFLKVKTYLNLCFRT